VKRLIWLLLLPLTIIFVAFAIANRHDVTVSLDPTPLAIEVPLYGLVFAGIFVGLLAGGLITWARAGKVRRQLREERRHVRRLETDVQKATTATDAAPGVMGTSETKTRDVVKAA